MHTNWHYKLLNLQVQKEEDLKKKKKGEKNP